MFGNEMAQLEANANQWDTTVFQIRLTPQEYQMVINEKKRRGIAF